MNTAARTEVRGARSLNVTAPRAQEFSNDDLLKLLVAVRGSSIPDTARVELRDLILEYSQIDDPTQKSDAATRLAAAIEPYRAAFGQPSVQSAPSIEASVPKEKNPSVSGIGRGRIAPSFQAPSVSEEAPRRIPVTSVDAPQPNVAEPKPKEPERVPAAAPVAVKETVTADPKVRITEIKRAINEQVGNPVNLIEKDKAIGQEYMSALLDAIKRSSAGGAGLETAMARLERAYEAADDLARNGPKVSDAPPQPEHKVAPEPEPAPKPAPVADPVPPPLQEIHEAPTPEPVKVQPVQQVTPVVQKANPSPAALSSLASFERRTEQVERRPVEAPKVPEMQPVQATEAPKADETFSVRALRAQKPSKGTPEQLHTQDIDAGLAQLLSEWKLFKRSGFLGTGPSGINHPLYKKLQSLPMAAVVAGRFEGATPEIRQTIADYMNGWRYEQGIVHKMEEQFEVYLRRVIKHILEKQKQLLPPNTPTAP